MFLYHGKEDEKFQLNAAQSTYDYLLKQVYQGDSNNIKLTFEDGMKHDDVSDKEK